MADDALIRMANQIAVNFRPYGEESAIARTAEHIRQFWEPRMRNGLQKVATETPEQLDPITLAAARSLAG